MSLRIDNECFTLLVEAMEVMKVGLYRERARAHVQGRKRGAFFLAQGLYVFLFVLFACRMFATQKVMRIFACTNFIDKANKIMLEIRNLHAQVEGKEILRGVNLTIGDGEVHVLMGPNGSGKSTLSHVIVGNPKFEVTEGEIIFNGKNMLELEPEERSHEGIFLSFQAPIEIPGVSMTNFMRAAINAKRKYFDQEPMPAAEFLKLLREKRKLVGLDAHFMSRGVNEGFSGGERKRNEIFQMAVLEPLFSILDETDSGLDVDALRIVAEGFQQLRTEKTSALVITHYQRMLDYIKPDFVHVLMNGRVVKEGTVDLGYEIEQRGFDWIREEVEQA